MDVFDELIAGLGAVEGVHELGLTDPEGRILFSSLPERVDSRLEGLQISRSDPTHVQETESDDSLLMAQGHIWEERCLDCRDGVREGDLAGVLYVDCSLESLRAEETRQVAALAHAKRDSLVSGPTTGVLGLVAAWLALFLLLRKLVVRPLSRVWSMMREIQRGHFKTRLGMTQQDELGEAARAGRQGKGFAVVAEEVRNLGARSAKAARETAELIEDAVKITGKGGRTADQTAAVLGEIVNGVAEVSALVEKIATGAEGASGAAGDQAVFATESVPV